MVFAIVVSATVCITIFWETEPFTRSIAVFNAHRNKANSAQLFRNIQDTGQDPDRHEEMVIRKWRVNDACQHLNPPDVFLQSDFEHIIVNDEHKILYCYVPKVACTNWKRIMLSLEKNGISDPLDFPADSIHNQTLFRTLDKFSRQEIDFRLRHYFKFLFVRHPFERLISAFRNKFQQNYSVYFQQRFGRLIVERYREDPEDSALLRGNDVTFAEFAQYLLDPRTLQDGPLNEHWRPMAHLCHPCKVEYDVIGKYESLDEDARYVLNVANISDAVEFPKLNKTVNTADLVSSYMSNVTKEIVSQLYNLYEMDFEIFGYGKDQYE